jgi:hypothetical protein
MKKQQYRHKVSTHRNASEEWQFLRYTDGTCTETETPELSVQEPLVKTTIIEVHPHHLWCLIAKSAIPVIIDALILFILFLFPP